jgi:hypothetical protein
LKRGAPFGITLENQRLVFGDFGNQFGFMSRETFLNFFDGTKIHFGDGTLLKRGNRAMFNEMASNMNDPHITISYLPELAFFEDG